MAVLDVPESGLSLRRGDLLGDTSPDSIAKPTQIMRLNLAQSTLDELVASLRRDQKARLRLGKHQRLDYGTKSQQFHSQPSKHRTEIYRIDPNDKDNIYFSGVLSHSLEVQKAKEATAATDEALATLEQSLSAFERGKESRKTPMITNIQDMKALGAGDSRSATGKQAALLARLPTSKIDVEKERFFKNAANRSMPGSPALGGPRSPGFGPALTPTSAPASQSKEKIRLEALRIPFIHLLAIRAVSVKFLSQQTRSTQEDCLALAHKYGTENKLNREKFDLKDKAYRDLDVWAFPYRTQDDRQEAIENAISAFDRMRISRSDKLWQMLLPKEERGKGKVLSRLDLRTGPIKKAVTPRIQIHASEDTGKDGDLTGNETDPDRQTGRLTPNAADSLSAKNRPATQKARSGDKDNSTKKASSRGRNTTLTGRVTKKTDKKTNAKTEGKFKSAEFVHDSDDDEDVQIPEIPPPKPSVEKAPPSPKSDKKGPVSKPAESKTMHSASTNSSRPRSQAAVKSPAKKTQPPPAKTVAAPSRPSGTTSPRKPSPLGSSPPTNASDIESSDKPSGQTSSSSSSPLIQQVNRQPRPSAPSTNVKNAPKPNGVHKPAPTAANPLKRKAVPERDVFSAKQTNGRINGHLTDAKRRRPIGSPSDSSSGSASPPLNRELRRRQLREKSQRFKQSYAKYRDLHDRLASQSDPSRADLDKLEKQHFRLQRMKKEIWEEDQRLRGGM